MKLLLDENITKKALTVFQNLGYDVESIQSLGAKGMDDNQVLAVAQSQNRALITQNGKDFIIQVPPRVAGVSHEGIFWLKYDFTRNMAEDVCSEFDSFISVKKSIIDEIWLHEVVGSQRQFSCQHP
ncbi:hypothetical protein BK767_26285 [Bacillus thuringiensis serovar kyushuensis]|uniref:DUF5615 family PIN-like protein n=1 Tax=Bacillus thuringiensis TaxID=1428 RepID=UPI000B442309|nr:DUF5615 family PIN-like protein [Bacillus thuringiensis]MEC2861586.1 DUF5615 family PIN-like protein [Bacillus cereus]OTZ63541.1 hypothetical protein BK767_26285 [Bacillus thuringiensis serovar kyushuensis]OTZ73984.1 hypothetical protein BK768_14705 [Bacillus thuringiensis serovar tohokuensis]OUB82661.1 hypothetical protein BK773_25860 [Bacillus thuringiensis serovar indiana]